MVEHVCVLNIMGTNYRKKYEGETISLRKLPNNVYSLTIVELFNHINIHLFCFFFYLQVYALALFIVLNLTEYAQ